MYTGGQYCPYIRQGNYGYGYANCVQPVQQVSQQVHDSAPEVEIDGVKHYLHPDGVYRMAKVTGEAVSGADGWIVVGDVEVEAGISVKKYRSTRTGITVALVDVQSPLVSGYFTLATEAFDDDGLPHTLEHLVFMGSELYPYKGVLDTLANRALAQGTNAWTDTDHTAYTLTCAGPDGFLRMLPIYLDHVLYPTNSDSACYTEVHHINGQGEDAGVVYCEMQGRENTRDSLTYRRMFLELFPGCGYSAETGGIMANLRTGLHEKIRQYHADYYRPDNLCIIITGKVDPVAMLQALEPVEERVVSKGPRQPKPRPWVKSPVPLLKASKSKVVEFPDDQEESGSVLIGWQAPSYSEFLSIEALRVLWDYLSDTAVSPLRKALVEISEPFCTDVSYSLRPGVVSSVICELDSVPTEKLGVVRDRFFNILKDVARSGFDMERMRAIIHLRRVQFLASLEKNGHEQMADALIMDFLYAHFPSDLPSSLATVAHLNTLEKRDNSFWVSMLQRNVLNQSHVHVVGRPSAALSEHMQQSEQARIAAQREKLGEAGLAELEKKLQAAMDKNDAEIPEDVLGSFAVPPLTSIPFIPVVALKDGKVISADAAAVGATEAAENLGSDTLPVSVEFSHIPSSFVEARFFFDTTSIPVNLRPYIELFLEVVFEAPINSNGVSLSHEEVVDLITRDLISYRSNCGLSGSNFRCGRFSQLLMIGASFEVSKYHKVMDFLRDVLWNSEDTVERLRISATKLSSDVADAKRSGWGMCRAAMKALNFTSESNHSVCNLVRQQKFLNEVIERCDSDPEGVLRDFAAFRAVALDPVKANLRVHVIGDISKLPRPAAPFLDGFVGNDVEQEELAPVPYAKEYLRAEAKDPKNKGVILPVAAIESSFLLQTRPGPDSFDHPDVVPLLVLIEYLTGMEGPFWKQIRGHGFAYGYGIDLHLEESLISFNLFKATNLVDALKQAKAILSDLLSGSGSFDENSIEAAQAGAVFGIVAAGETMAEAAKESFNATNFMRVPFDHSRATLQRISEVTSADLTRVAKKYIEPLLDPHQTHTAITVNPSKAEEIKVALEDMGYNIEVADANQLLA